MDNILTSKKRKRVPPKRFYDEVFPSYKRKSKQSTPPIYETTPAPIYNALIFLPAIIFMVFIPLHIWLLVTIPFMIIFIMNRLTNTLTEHDDGGIEFVENITADDRQRMAEEKGEVISVD